MIYCKMKLSSYFTTQIDSDRKPIHNVNVTSSLPEDFYMKARMVVWIRSQLTLAVICMTQPFYSIYGVINTLTNKH